MGRKDQLVEGAEADGLFTPCQSALHLARAAHCCGAEHQHGAARRAQRYGLFESDQSGRPIALDDRDDKRCQPEGSGIVGSVGDRGMGVVHRSRASLRINEPSASEQHFETQGKEGMGEAVIGLKGERALQ